MSIDMYLSTSNDQALSVSKLCKSQVEGYNEATKAINDFVLNSPTLKGKAYDSGKSYFNALLVPLVKGGILLSEAVEKAVKKFPEDYVEKVDSTSLKESELEERLQEVSNLLSRAENTRAELNSSKTPDLSKSFQLASNTMIIGMYETAKQKIEDQLRKLREFDAQSPQLFSEIASINHSINAGLSQVGKAWDASTGTFDQTRITDRTWATALNDEWDSRAERLEKELADEFAKEMQGRRYFRVQLATGAYEWMWVKDPSKVTQEDFQFNGKYKSYLDTLLNPKNSELDDYYITMAEELRSGINSKTGEPLTNLEKAQRWSAVASAISLIAIGAYYGKKGFTAEGNTTVKKASGANRPQTMEEFLKEMDELPRARLSKKVGDGLVSTPNGKRLDPSVYMSKAEIEAHLSLFDDGVVRVQSKENFDFAINTYGPNIGDPKTGTYVMPKSVADKAISVADGNPRILEELLGLEPMSLGENPVLLDIQKTTNMRVPSGNESGAWQGLWEPGGFTNGGIPEAVVDTIKGDEYIVKNVFK